MLRQITAASLGLALLGGTAGAEVPEVVTDIAPVQSLVATVMGPLGDPKVILPPGASPHGYAMRPSDAVALQKAGLVFWVGEALAPWLEHPLETLPANATVVELMELPGTLQLQFRSGAELEAHHDGEEGHDDHDHADHDDHAHDDHDHDAAAHDDHDHDHDAHDEDGHEEGHEEGHEGHHHVGLDPHGWLDPENARAWLSGIAEALAEADPEHADTYRANAEAARARLAEQESTIAAELAARAPIRFLVFHDAYQYFENRFGLTSSGAITDGDAATPGAGRIAALNKSVAEAGVDCVFTEPQFNAGLAESVTGKDGSSLVEIDPLGSKLTPGADLYPQLIDAMAASFLACKG